MHLHYIKSRVLPALLLTLIASCSTKQVPEPKTQTVPNTGIEEIAVDLGTLSAAHHIELAQTLETNAAIGELLIATKLFYQQQNYPKALWLADKIMPLMDEQVSHNTHEKVQLVLIKASSLQKLGFYTESHLQLNQLEQFANENNILLTATYYRLLSTVFQEQKRPISALNAQLLAFSFTQKSSQSQQQIDSIWRNLQSLSQWQLSLLALDKAPDSKGWLQLTTLANRFGDDQKKMQYQLSIWKNKFKLHPANVIASQLTAQAIIPKNIENIAVILPLSGKQNTAGRAIQQGILASFANEKTKALHFIDSNTVNWYGLTNELSTLKIDYVIGPLLKSNVDKYISYTSAQTQAQNDYLLNASSDLFDINKSEESVKNSTNNQNKSIDYITAIDSESAINSYLQTPSNSNGIDTLLLNIPTKTSLTSQHTVFSMRPEDEARQAAVTLSRQNFKRPVVLSQKNIVSKRIAQAFAKQWKRITGDTIEVVDYDTGSQMQDNIKASLSVNKSKIRIDKLKSRLNQSIKTQTRNRRDIDMIYLVGTPEQTRLVKPYIAVNISPFADVIPVFASSRSHSTQSDYSSNSDLQGLTFTEIPWLLAGEQNAELSALSQQLWPKRSDGLSRLFAMGYDSYQLINKIPLMQQAPYLQHWGQTGVLKLDDNNILTRSLLWGAYKRNKVVSIAME
ncbi:penicillin-binding protein activator [Colwellia sp. 75C3]|uniref:penicillin-binding protein activator n=1 Tax=Colwellia sp. 75C3 TaxID=888425 RepID=UPI000C32DE77|nr:penicillin-binding protein activator [Colwellia sp. 75C3]PKG85364.1 penicillin-binding protein activator [Colwellia sp. 75C3]